MTLSLLGGKTKTQQDQIDIRETFALWDALAYKYFTMERMLLWDNYVHDPDLKVVLHLEIRDLEKNISVLEKLMQKYGVPSPDKHRKCLCTAANAEVINDRFIAKDIFLSVQESIEGLSTAFRSSITNDKIRTELRKMVMDKVKLTDSLMSYMALRGYLGIVPAYKKLPNGVNESISSAEASNLWDHLTYRYDNIHFTNIFKAFVHDKDFLAMLDIGVNLLTEQVAILEKELDLFAIPFPQRPGNVTISSDLQSIENDLQFYRNMFLGIQGAATLHAKAYKQCTTNDRIRKTFKRLLIEEIEKTDDIIRFGKLKGWLNPVPTYGN